MAKTNGKNNDTKNDGSNESIASATQKVTKIVKPKPEEETHGGLVAAIVALVALIIIGCGVLAFVLLLKAKDKYVDKINPQKPETEAGLGVGATIGTTGNIASSTGSTETPPEVPITQDDTETSTGDDSTSVAPDDTTDSTDDETDEGTNEGTGDEEEEDQPTPVIYYDFDAQLSRMDNDMEAVNPNNLDSNEINNNDVGLN